MWLASIKGNGCDIYYGRLWLELRWFSFIFSNSKKFNYVIHRIWLFSPHFCVWNSKYNPISYAKTNKYETSISTLVDFVIELMWFSYNFLKVSKYQDFYSHGFWNFRIIPHVLLMIYQLWVFLRCYVVKRLNLSLHFRRSRSLNL